MIDDKVIKRKMNPPTLLPESGSSCNLARSSFVFGNNLTKRIPLVCIAVVSTVSFTNFDCTAMKRKML